MASVNGEAAQKADSMMYDKRQHIKLDAIVSKLTKQNADTSDGVHTNWSNDSGHGPHTMT